MTLKSPNSDYGKKNEKIENSWLEKTVPKGKVHKLHGM